MSRISETTNSGVMRIADDQFAILVNLLNKVAGNTPASAHAAIASVGPKPTRPADKPVPTPHHAPTIVAPVVVAQKPVPTPAAPGYKLPPPPATKPVDQLSPAFGGPSNPAPTTAPGGVKSFGEPFEPGKPAPMLTGAPKPTPKPEPKPVPSPSPKPAPYVPDHTPTPTPPPKPETKPFPGDFGPDDGRPF
jgi:hypothetical protein